MEHLNEYLDFIRTVEGIKSVTRTAWTKQDDRKVRQNILFVLRCLL